MPSRQIDNPILNGPFDEPTRHFEFDGEGMTDTVINGRRISTYFVPIPQPKKKGKQLVFDKEWTKDRMEEAEFVNRVRTRVSVWRSGHYPGTTKTTARLLEYWRNPERERRLFFCQIEALETAIYLTEAATKYGDAWIAEQLRQENQRYNPLLDRIAFKMATGSGKTVVMAMLIAWHTLNKLANPQDARFSDTFLLVTPGITIRDRLRVLLPSDPENYYVQRDIVPSWNMDELGQAKIVIGNYHAFLLREREKAGKLTKQLLTRDGQPSPFKETPDQMVRRVCRELGNKRNIVVINDEAHHCYRGKPAEVEADEPAAEKLTGDDRREAERRNEEARVWISGLEAIKSKLGIRAVYDLSATPFFLRGSGYGEGTIFPWVVSDFSLLDAIEAGIVKVPRVPVADDSLTGDQPAYREIWHEIRDKLPKKGRKGGVLGGQPDLPGRLEGAIQSLYSDYEKSYRRWEKNEQARANGLTPPVFIVVCNNTSVSKLVFDYIAGWEKELPDGSKIVVPGALPIFSNEQAGGWTARPNTILVDSQQLESGEAMSAEFKQFAAVEIEEFKAEYRARFPGRDVDNLADEDLLREVMNTVGKAGKLGEHIKCVVSVSMLTEGWDANTVTHILGVRAFGTQLLCEQVVGRGLRRMSYALDENGRFRPEYAEVYGVPFSLMAGGAPGGEIDVGPPPTRVRTLPERSRLAMSFPRLAGYRYDIIEPELKYRFSEASELTLSTADVPSFTENQPVVGEGSIHTLDDLKARREQEVAFLLAKLTLEKYFRLDGEQRKDRPPAHQFDSEVQVWRFQQLLAIARHWLDECVTLKDKAFKQMLLLIENAHDAADRIYQAIVSGDPGDPARKVLRPILLPYDTVGTTGHVDFTTIRPTYQTDPAKCHISHVVCDTTAWEQHVAQALEQMDEVLRYVKNDHLGFTIPYTLSGDEHQYFPDFLADVDDGRGPDDPLHLILEVTGEKKKDKQAKVATAKTLWIPAVNNAGVFGRWDFIEIDDVLSTQGIVRHRLRR
jgi:type III restriction enzyme